MKKILSFVKKKKRDPPPGSAASACSAGAYEIRRKELTKLHRGAAAGDLALVQQGLKKHDIDERDKAQRTPLHLACANGREDVVTFLVENKCKLNLFDSDNRSPLMKAVQCQKERCAVILLEHGADPNLADAGGNTALHLAAVTPNTFLAGMLIEHSARINAQNKDGCTPLTLAISENHKEMVELLLKKGADVHTRDPCERTPLMTAAAGGELKLVEILLRYGAEIFHKDVNGWTAEDYAILHGNASLSKTLAEYADHENAGEASAGAKGGIPVPVTPHQARAAGFTLGAAASSRGEMQRSPEQTLRTGESSEAMDDFFEGYSTSSEKEGSNGTWNNSEEEELDFTAKKPQKPNLTSLMNVPQKFRNNGGGDSSRIEIPKSQKKSLKQKKPTGANLSRGECGELLKQDVSDSGNLEEDELVEEEEGQCKEKESPKWKEEQEKEDTRRKLQTTVLGDVKHSVSSNKHQVRKVSEDTAYARKAQPTVGAEKKEESDSPWDSEPCSEGSRKASPPVFLPPAVEHGVRLQSVSGEHNKGALPAVGTEKKEESDSPWDSEVLSVICASPRSVGEPDENYVRACLCVEPRPW